MWRTECLGLVLHCFLRPSSGRGFGRKISSSQTTGQKARTPPAALSRSRKLAGVVPKDAQSFPTGCLRQDCLKGQHFTLWTWNLGSEPQAVADAFINPDGLVVSRLADATRKVTEDPIDVRAFAGRGERKQFALTSDDWALQAFAEAVPFPIEQSANGCTLSVEMSAPNYVGVLLHGSGFRPSESLAIEVTSGPQGGKQQATTSPAGTYTAVIFPAAKGQKSGKASVTITSPKCSVAVQFPWGDGSYKIQ